MLLERGAHELCDQVSRSSSFSKRQAGARPLRISEINRGGKPQTYEAVARVMPSPRQLKQYAGTYDRDELDTAYRFEVVKGKLALLRKKGKGIHAYAYIRGQFLE